MRLPKTVSICALLMVCGGCGPSGSATTPAKFDPNDLERSLMWLKEIFAPIRAVKRDGQNPLVVKEHLDEEQKKLLDHLDKVKDIKVRWHFGVADMEIDSFALRSSEKIKGTDGTIVGQFRMYREAQPRIEAKGILLPEKFDHQIRRFKVNEDISAERYKELNPKSRLPVQGNLFDVSVVSKIIDEKGAVVGPNDWCFDLVLVNVRVADK